ncbi:MAG: hypothetical protein Q8P62_00460 [Candidatus Peregrinibacteria bacterium]|nr:hypothetical protein [Candidatus Peregrinibacteria bacterium]
MEKTYIWFAIKTNFFLFIITIFYGKVFGSFLFPVELLFPFAFSALLKFLIFFILIGIGIAILSYIAFKYSYRGVAMSQNIRLIDAILYVIALQIFVDLIYINFSQEKIEVYIVIISFLLKAGIMFSSFYFAGINCRQPSNGESGKTNDNNQSPPPPPSYFNPQI